MEERFDSFEVTILNWSKHNESKKKGHTHILLATRFFDDSKIQALTPQERCAFIWLLLRCGDEMRATIVATSKQMRSACGANTLRVESALKRLEQLQLVRIEKINPLLDRIGKKEKGKERKGEDSREVVERPSQAHISKPPVELVSAPKEKPNPEKNRPTWEAYREAYQTRYGVEPIRDQTTNSCISKIVRRVGQEEAPDIMRFYLRHNDALYLKSTHSITLAVRDIESLRTQWLKGRAITMKDVRDFERKSSYQEQIEKINRGEI